MDPREGNKAGAWLTTIRNPAIHVQSVFLFFSGFDSIFPTLLPPQNLEPMSYAADHTPVHHEK
jgi:hypothetical protein